MKPCKLNSEEIKKYAKEYNWNIEPLQIAIYVATGGGFLGKSYAERPKSAYIDARVGKLPYTRAEIENIKQTLIAIAEANGLDPYNLPPMPNFHNCGIF